MKIFIINISDSLVEYTYEPGVLYTTCYHTAPLYVLFCQVQFPIDYLLSHCSSVYPVLPGIVSYILLAITLIHCISCFARYSLLYTTCYFTVPLYVLFCQVQFPVYYLLSHCSSVCPVLPGIVSYILLATTLLHCISCFATVQSSILLCA